MKNRMYMSSSKWKKNKKNKQRNTYLAEQNLQLQCFHMEVVGNDRSHGNHYCLNDEMAEMASSPNMVWNCRWDDRLSAEYCNQMPLASMVCHPNAAYARDHPVVLDNIWMAVVIRVLVDMVFHSIRCHNLYKMMADMRCDLSHNSHNRDDK